MQLRLITIFLQLGDRFTVSYTVLMNRNRLPMYSETIARLEKFDNAHDLERLCADILAYYRQEDIELTAPRGGRDGGKDITFLTNKGGKGLACVTLRKDIEKKFREDFHQRQAGEFEKYYFFCIVNVTAAQKQQFKRYCQESLQAELIIQDIEALRCLLDGPLTSIRQHYLGMKEAKENAHNALRDEDLVRCDYYAHVPMPPNYIDRLDISEEVCSKLLNDQSSEKLIALFGMGGSGKTVIARSLCDNPNIQATFPDGILWLTLGKNPNLVTKMYEWIHELGGRFDESALTEDNLKNTLAKLLKNRACLLIIDDVWQYKNINNFRLGGSQCKLLFTTRDAQIARELGANIITISCLKPTEAVILLERWAQGHLIKVDIELKNQIVNRVGCLPLAVKLAGAQLQRKSPEEWLQTFNIHKLKSSRVENDDVALTLKLSIDELDHRTSQLYISLAIFREDEVIPQVGIERLWQGLGQDSSGASELIDDLAARALLDISLDQTKRIVQLHSLFRDLLNVELGEKHITTHRTLLKIYRNLHRSKGWHTITDDGYLYEHLAYHLSQANLYEDLQGLFADHQWLHVRFSQQTAYYNYLGDLMLAWQSAVLQAKQQVEQNKELNAFIDVFRCTLIWTKIKSLAKNYTPEVILRAAEVDLWTIGRVLRETQDLPDLFQQALIYVRLLHTHKLNNEQIAEILVSVQEALEHQGIKYAYKRAKILVLLLPHIDQSLRTQLLDKEVLSLTSMDAGEEQAKILVLLLPHIDQSLHTHLLTLSITSTLEQDFDEWLDVLSILAPYFSTELFKKVLGMAQEIKDSLELEDKDIDWLQISSALAMHFTQEQRTEIFEIALAYEDDFWRVKVLIPLIPYLTAEQRIQILETVLSSYHNYAYHLLIKLTSSNLTEKQCDLMLSAIRFIGSYEERKIVIEALAPQLTLRQIQLALKAMQETDEKWEYTAILVFLASHVIKDHQSQLISRILEMALRPQPDASGISLLLLVSYLGYHLNDSPSKAELDELLKANLLIKLTPVCSKVHLDFISTSPYIIGSELLSILFWAEKSKQSLVLPNHEILKNKFEVSQMLKPSWKSSFALSALVPLLSVEQIAQLFEIVLRSGNEWDRVKILVTLAPYLSENQRIRALNIIPTFKSEKAITFAFLNLAPHLTIAHYTLARDIAQNFRDKLIQLKALTALFPLLTVEERSQAFEATLSLPDEGENRHLLIIQAPYLMASQRSQILETAWDLKNKYMRSLMVATLLPYMDTEQHNRSLNRILEESFMPSHDFFDAKALVYFLPFFSDPISILQFIRDKMLDFLSKVQIWSFSEILRSCFIYNIELFTPPILPSDILGTIMSHIIEISEDWEWL
jgi:hypothetical protein